MDNLLIAIVSDDADYSRALSHSLISVSRDIQVNTFGSRQFVRNWSEHSGRIPYYETFDIVLWAGEEIRESYSDNIVFLSDKVSEEKMDYKESRFSLYKYCTARTMASAVFDIYSYLSGRNAPELKNANMHIVGFASCSGGVGCSTIAMAAAQEFCRFRGRKVLYISMEDVESTEAFFQVNPHVKTIGEYLYRLLGRRTSIADKSREVPYTDSYMIKDMFGVEAFRPSGGRNPLRALKGPDMDRFLGGVIGCGRFNTIVIDFGCCLSEAAITAMSEADRICFVVKPQEIETRVNHYMNQISFTDKLPEKFIRATNFWEEGSEMNNEHIQIRKISKEHGGSREILAESGFGADIGRLVDALVSR